MHKLSITGKWEELPSAPLEPNFRSSAVFLGGVGEGVGFIKLINGFCVKFAERLL